jgi:hypothetical protein
MNVTLSQMRRMIREVRRAGEKVNFDFGGRMNTVKVTQLYEAVQMLFFFPL